MIYFKIMEHCQFVPIDLTACSHPFQVALSNISPATAEPGASGGCFNSATRFKCIALPSLSQQLTHRGWRNIRIHSQRYIPSMNKQRTLSDSAVKTLKLQQHQQLNLLNRERDMEMAERRCASTHNPHRLTFSFYMGGSSARMFRKGFFLSENKVGQASDFDSPLTPRSNLYYGQGIRGQRPLSNILERRLHQHWREEEQKRIGTASLATTTCNMMDTVEESSLESHHASPTHPLELTGVRAFIGTIRERVFVTES